MLPFVIGFLGYGKMVFGWLSRLSLPQIVCLILVCALVIDHSALLLAHRHSRKVEAQLIKCSEAQRKLVEQGKKQQHQVGKIVDHYITVTKPVVRKQVEKIETAPLPGNCRTPKAVLDADV